MSFFSLVLLALKLEFHLTGRYLSMLPMEPKLGKMLILGAIFNCLDPVLTIVAGLSVKDPFLAPLDKKDVSNLCASMLRSWDYLDGNHLKGKFSTASSWYILLVRL